jgi:predicted membrane protein
MSSFSIFGDIKRINRATRLEGENYTVIFGDVKIDFTRTPLLEGDHQLRIISLFGDVKLRFPEHVGVSLDGFTLFGENEVEYRSSGDEETVGNNYETANFGTTRTRVYIRVFSLFGDVDITLVPAAPASSVAVEAQPQLEYRPEEQIYDGQTRKIEHRD